VDVKTKVWTDSDFDRLVSFARMGLSSTDAAKSLRRSPGAVRFKAFKNGIRFTSLGVTHSRKQKARWAKKGKGR
jgi:predicted lipoprotein